MAAKGGHCYYWLLAGSPKHPRGWIDVFDTKAEVEARRDKERLRRPVCIERKWDPAPPKKKANPGIPRRRNHWLLPMAVGAGAMHLAHRAKLMNPKGGAHARYGKVPAGYGAKPAKRNPAPRFSRKALDTLAQWASGGDTVQVVASHWLHGHSVPDATVEKAAAVLDHYGDPEASALAKRLRATLKKRASGHTKTNPSAKRKRNPQRAFNPVDYHFRWTQDWYEWDRAAAVTAARQARDAETKRLKALGHRVMKWSLPGQLITRGGIGSGHPQIENVVTSYMLDWQ